MSISVTFDSNVWRIVADPARHPKDPLLSTYNQIRSAVVDGRISAFLSETVFTLETIRRKNRRIFFGNYMADTTFSHMTTPDGAEQLAFSIGPNLAAHPGNEPTIAAYLAKALQIGFRILKVPRIGMIINPDIRAIDYASYPGGDFIAYVNALCNVNRQMLASNCGMYHILAIGQRYMNPGENWLTGLDNAPSDQDGNILKAIAEWADGDTIAVHIANQNQFLLTNDKGKSGGKNSVFSPNNLSWLSKEFNLMILDPINLAASL